MAMFVYNKLKKDKLLVQALNFDLDRRTNEYKVVLAGHSLAAGVTAVLSMVMKSEFPHLHCYAFCPPSGIIRESYVEETKSFITSIVVGKDLVPRIGINQVETFRRQMIESLASCPHSKWRIICSASCCHSEQRGTGTGGGLAVVDEKTEKIQSIEGFTLRQTTSDNESALRLPGKIIHIVRNHPKAGNFGCLCSKDEPVFQAIWVENADFDEILISPTMLSDHSPYNVLDALKKVLTHISPAKPSRKPTKNRSGVGGGAQNTSSDVCEPSTSDVHLRQTDLDVELVGTAHAIPRLNHSIDWNDVDLPGEFCDVATAAAVCGAVMERPKHFSMKPRQTGVVELRRDDRLDVAPLASPELMSETSSLASFGSAGGGSLRYHQQAGGGYQRLTSGVAKMDPIKQSPLSHPVVVHSSARGYSLLAEPLRRSHKGGQDVGYIVLSPLSEPPTTTETSKFVRSTAANGGDGATRDERGIDDVDVETSFSRDERSRPSTAENQTSSSTDTVGDSRKNASSDVGGDCLETSGDVGGFRKTTASDVVVGDFRRTLADVEVHAPLSESVGTEEEEGVLFKPVSSSEAADAMVCSIDSLEGAAVSARRYDDVWLPANREPVESEFDADSIDSLRGRQYLYDAYAGHYSPAGRGYPHGFGCFHERADSEAGRQSLTPYRSLDGRSNHLVMPVRSLDGSGNFVTVSNCSDSGSYATPSADDVAALSDGKESILE